VSRNQPFAETRGSETNITKQDSPGSGAQLTFNFAPPNGSEEK
jgi:hypothetical protein